MRREEPRTGRIADYEFQFWECWESDDTVSGTPERYSQFGWAGAGGYFSVQPELARGQDR